MLSKHSVFSKFCPAVPRGGFLRSIVTYLPRACQAALRRPPRRKEFGGNKSTQTLSAPDAPAREATSGEMPDERLLFPELTDSDISEIHIRAGDDCAFDFSLRGELSVNGQKADGEVFSTLLDQLTADCFVPCEDFEPRGEPLLTVTVSTDTQDFSARFYQDSEDGKYAYVVAGADKARCLKTDAWRVGTLLLTCEGTRIFDASGQETPVD